MILSVVIPCLNEEETIAICIKKALSTFKKIGIDNMSEVIVADNGSDDNSTSISKKLGAKIVSVKKRGYGRALRQGINAAKGKYIVIADADNSYDFNIIDKFYYKLNQGYDLVQGCRYPSGGGIIKKKAMPISHKYIGNPFFSFLCKLFFNLPFNDVYCGYRAFRKDKFMKLNHFSNGMVFALENLIKFKIAKYKCTEIPVTLYKDGRINNKSHLNTFSDGWKTLKFLLIICPKWLYYIPSGFFLLLGTFFLIIFFQNFNHDNQINNLIQINSILIYFLLSLQVFMFGIFSSLLASKLQLLDSKFVNFFFNVFKLKYAFFIFYFILLIIVMEVFFINLLNIPSIYLEMILSYTVFFGFVFLANSLFVSLLTID
jgi:glycosyltransferase involved in cell wall biosynthesis